MKKNVYQQLVNAAVFCVRITALISLITSQFFGAARPVLALSPAFTVQPDHGWIGGQEWTALNPLTLIIDETEPPDPPYLYTDATQTVAGDGSFWFNVEPDFDLQVGQYITLSDGVTQKSTQITEVHFDTINEGTDTAIGRGPAGQPANVYVRTDTDEANLDITIGSGGDWTADFSPPLDIQTILDANIQVFDTDGDGTTAHLRIPNFSARFPEKEVHGYGWIMGSSVTLSIDDPDYGTSEDYTATLPVIEAPWDASQTFVQFTLALDPPSLGFFELQPDQIITMTDGNITKVHTVSILSITGIDVDIDTITGTVEGDSTVDVDANCGDSGCAAFQSVIASSGIWTVDFSGVGGEDIQPGSSGEARAPDMDGDTTTVQWNVPNPRFTVQPDHGWVGGSDWAVGNTLTLIVDDAPVPALPYLFTDSQTVAGDGSVWFNVEPGFDLLPGQYITLSDTVSTKSTQIEEVHFDSLNEGTNIAAGSGPNNALGLVYIRTTSEQSLDIIIDPSGNWEVDFSPFDTSNVQDANVQAYDTDGDSTMAHLPLPIHNVTQDLYYQTIQAAVAASFSGDTIEIQPGTYTEIGQIVIDNNLTIVGADMTTTIIKPNTDTGSSGDGKGWFLVNSGVVFNLSNVTLDGTGLKIWQAIRHHGSGVIDHVKFTSIKYEESGPAYNGAGVEVITTGNIDVKNSEFSEMGRYGVQVWDGGGTATGTYSGNTYTGKGVGNWLDYAFEIGWGAHITIQDNVITNNKGVASSDGSVSSAISVWDDLDTQATITGNTLTNNTVGVAIAVINGGGVDPTVTMGAGNVISDGTTGIDVESAGAFGSPTLTVTGATISNNVDGLSVVSGMTAGNIQITNSLLTGNSNSGVTNNGTGIVNATYNWWGAASGPGVVGLGTGDKVSTNVNFSPWCANAACTVFGQEEYTLTYTAGANGSITGDLSQTVDYGSDGTAVTAVPAAGYHFVNWSDLSTANPRTDTNVTANVTVTANFAINSYTLTYTAGANGSITGDLSQTVDYGSDGTAVTAVPAAGYHFVNWSDLSTANPRTDTNVTANVTVTANFAINNYTLTYTAGANGSITGDLSQTVDYGSDGTAVTAVPAAGYHFVNWSDLSTANPRTDTNVTANVTVTANFAINNYTLTYTAGANGSITGDLSQTVDYGSDGTAVTAVPAAGYHFVNWSDLSTANPRTDTNVTANVTVTANFAINSYTLTYTAGANGSITGDLSQTVNYGSDGTAVTAVPAAGYHFVNWSDLSTANPRTDTNVTANVTVTANFAINNYTLTYTAGANGSITGDLSQTVDYGSDGTAVTAVPAAGYHFVNWSDLSTANPRTDTNVTANVTVTANFAINSYTLTYTAGANGSIVGTTPQTVAHGADGSLVTATPAAGYHFVSWSDGVLTASRTDTNVTANISVTANFAINTHTLTVSNVGGGSGTVTSSPSGINCGVDCSETYDYNTSVTLTATPATGSTFTGWSGGGCSGTGTCTVVMTANKFVSANFNTNSSSRYTTGVFRPSNGLLYLKNTNTTGFADIAINYGMPGDYPVVGDWDGNGTDTIGVYRNGVFYLRNSNTIGFADMVFAFGSPGDQPIAGDWNNDAIDTIGVYRNGVFFLRNNNSAGPADTSFGLGNPGDVGIAGDWNGDGFDTTGVFRPSNGVIFLKNANTTGFADIALNYGLSGDQPVTGDWNNDGRDTIGVYRNGVFLLRNTNTIGFADIVFALGIPGDMPIAGNWDGLP